MPSPLECAACGARQYAGDNDHCVYDGTPHDWHRCEGIVAPDSNCPNGRDHTDRGTT